MIAFFFCFLFFVFCFLFLLLLLLFSHQAVIVQFLRENKTVVMAD